MPFKQRVEIGRLALIVFGEEADKLCVITDVIDSKRVVVDVVGGVRQSIPVARIKLTSFLVDIVKSSPESVVQKAAQESVNNFYQTNWGKSLLSRKNREQMNDFQRFKYTRSLEKRDLLVKDKLNGVEAAS